MIHNYLIKDSINITGKGTLLICELRKHLIMFDQENTYQPVISVNSIISIDDKKFMVRGVDKTDQENAVGLIISHQYEWKNLIGHIVVFDDKKYV